MTPMTSPELAAPAGRWSWVRGPLRVPRTPLNPGRLHQEALLVLGVGLGSSAVFSVLDIVRRLTAKVPLNQQASELNTSSSNVAWLDLIYQLVQIAFALVPVLLALHLLQRDMRNPLWYLGIDRTRLVPDASLGALLAAAIGIPGLVLYVTARALGLNTEVIASSLGQHWWSLPILVLSAIQNAVLEEVIMVGYLFTRWTQAGWALPKVLLVSAVIRGSYHLYQGFGGFVGNIVMGLILGLVYVRTRRVLPLVITHALLDTVAFVGYALLHTHVSWM